MYSCTKQDKRYRTTVLLLLPVVPVIVNEYCKSVNQSINQINKMLCSVRIVYSGYG